MGLEECGAIFLLLLQVQRAAQLASQLSTVQNSTLQQKEDLSQSESRVSELNTKYHESITHLRFKLSTAMQDEAVLLEKWKGQSQQLADIKLSLSADKACTRPLLLLLHLCSTFFASFTFSFFSIYDLF